MDMYTAGLVQHLYPLDRANAPHRSDEDAYYAAHTGFSRPHWLSSLIAAIHAPLRRLTATIGATPDRITKLA